jgi:hypothetical protein
MDLSENEGGFHFLIFPIQWLNGSVGSESRIPEKRRFCHGDQKTVENSQETRESGKEDREGGKKDPEGGEVRLSRLRSGGDGQRNLRMQRSPRIDLLRQGDEKQISD